MDTPKPSDPITWRLHLRSAPAAVYELLADAEGRARFWAEEAGELAGGAAVLFRFPNGQELQSRVLAREPGRLFALTYFGGSRVRFELAADGAGGTDLRLVEEGTPPAERRQNEVGWVAVLLALKAAADFGVDLRNHDPRRTWDTGFVDA